MKVLIIGLGSIAKKHIAALRTIDSSIEIYALRNSSKADTYESVINIYTFEEIENLNVRFAIISNPTSLHAATIERLIPLKIPLFIEKPVFESLHYESLVTKIKNMKIISYVACNLRFLESLRFAKPFLETKRVNEVNVYCGSYLPDWRPGQEFRQQYSANKEMGGGVHIDLIHELDYVAWIFKQPKEVVRSTSNVSSLSISAVDYANFLLKYDSFNVNIVLNYYRRDAKRTMEVVCEEGTLLVDLLKNVAYWNNQTIFQSQEGIHDTYLDQMNYFIAKVLTKRNTFNTIDEAYQTLKLCITND